MQFYNFSSIKGLQNYRDSQHIIDVSVTLKFNIRLTLAYAV